MRRVGLFLLLAMSPWTVANAEDESERAARGLGGDTPEQYEQNIVPLIADLNRAKLVAIYEGLPHPNWEGDVLAAELKNKKSVTLHNFPFYAAPIALKDGDAAKLDALCKDRKTFGRYGGQKFCGGFHPDWCVEFKTGEDICQVLICFGCREARVYSPKNALYSDLDKEALKNFVAILRPLRTHRPKPEFEAAIE